jgi:hypothetical protein
MHKYAFALLVAAATIAPIAGAVPPLSQFDGRWSVVIQTDRGNCDRAYRYGLRIQNGNVAYAGDAAFAISGQVLRNGKVHVRVSRGSSYADGHGQMSRDSGSGTWRGVGMGVCSGRWFAERR